MNASEEPLRSHTLLDFEIEDHGGGIVTVDSSNQPHLAQTVPLKTPQFAFLFKKELLIFSCSMLFNASHKVGRFFPNFQ